MFLFCGSANASAKPWVMCYFPDWELGNGSTNSTPPLSAVDFSSMTAVAYFGFEPNSDGTIDTSQANSSAARLLAASAHARGAKVLLSLGGWNTQSGFEGATSAANIGGFVENILSLVREYGFDGIDLDWEPYSGSIPASDYPGFTELVQMLRDSLNAMGSGRLLTSTSSSGNEALMAKSQEYLDQINLMTYDLSAEYGGWPTWYNSAIYSDGDSLDGGPLPNVNSMVRDFEKAGVDSSKIGIGCEFAGTVWVGASLPDILPVSVTLSTTSDVPLYTPNGTGILQEYFSSGYYHWDPRAMVGYLSIPAGSISLLSPPYFITYDDSASIAAKFDYIRRNHLGGIIVYELGGGYPPGSPDYPLLAGMKKDEEDTTLSAIKPGPPQMPRSVSLMQNYPDPFNPSTTIGFAVRNPGIVTLKVYDVLGRLITTLVNSWQTAGEHYVVFNGTRLASGVYFYTLFANGRENTMRMILLK